MSNQSEAEKQEPVIGVEVKRIASGGFIGNVWWIHENLQEGVFHLYTHPQPKREPVAWEQLYPDIGKPQLEYLPASPFDISGKPQPKREWVGLTHEDVQGFADQYWGDDNMTMRSMFRAIEAKLKEKNV